MELVRNIEPQEGSQFKAAPSIDEENGENAALLMGSRRRWLKKLEEHIKTIFSYGPGDTHKTARLVEQKLLPLFEKNPVNENYKKEEMHYLNEYKTQGEKLFSFLQQEYVRLSDEASVDDPEITTETFAEFEEKLGKTEKKLVSDTEEVVSIKDEAVKTTKEQQLQERTARIKENIRQGLIKETPGGKALLEQLHKDRRKPRTYEEEERKIANIKNKIWQARGAAGEHVKDILLEIQRERGDLDLNRRHFVDVWMKLDKQKGFFGRLKDRLSIGGERDALEKSKALIAYDNALIRAGQELVAWMNDKGITDDAERRGLFTQAIQAESANLNQLVEKIDGNEATRASVVAKGLDAARRAIDQVLKGVESS